ncbi:hypothetical protein GLOIN_2v1571020 [Rhizophagus clarus]|uniref:Crinkler effector protein N-terminal domain-containing protein n=1 Tax=Rhizophagus clarus TaxID=94130 RepID=A0A8H3M0B0_9GLOM|nr:hypothetical protein GLOIN_2v1571020 [Rhizophagus clarus]
MSIITLSCLVVGENPYENAFEVDIEINKSISRPQGRYQGEASPKEELGGVELLPLSKISKYFPSQPADEHIHIIVQRPVETKVVHCTATYGRKSKKFQWTVTRGQITLSALKSRLRTCFTLPDGTEDEHIVINRAIWTRGLKVDLPIVVDTSQQPFSSWTFPQIKTLFGLTADSYIDLPRPAFSRNWCGANEATRREFISSVLHGVSSCYDGEVKVCPEYELSGSHGKGPVDWVIKIGDTIIVVIEAKREDINQGVGQNTIQLQASSQRNKKKRTYNEALREDVMYGIVSTGVNWVIIKLVTTGECNDNDNGNVEELLSSRTPFTFLLTRMCLTKVLCLKNSRICLGKSSNLGNLDRQIIGQ